MSVSVPGGSSTVAGTLLMPDTGLLKDARMSFIPISTPIAGAGGVLLVGVTKTVTSGKEDATFSIELAQGYYSVAVTGVIQVTIYVPGGGGTYTIDQIQSGTPDQIAAVIGVPSGGATGQVLAKSSSTNYAVEWVTLSPIGLPTSADIKLVGTRFLVWNESTGLYHRAVLRLNAYGEVDWAIEQTGA